MEEMCRFCNIVNSKGYKAENQPIMENSNYFSIASIGALVEGWVLIVPKKHVISMKDLYVSKDFIDFTNDMLSVLKLRYPGPYIAFEHGPNKCGSNTSCGTDHAHLHIVPYCDSLYNDMTSTGLIWENCNANQISSRVGSNEYLFYSEISDGSSWEDHKGYIHALAESISQYFRKIIAKQIGRADEYDYKKNACVDVAIETNRQLSMAIAHERE